ncbi:hypothetical protein [Luoshenia tenuis]|jgi:hypothetical protein|uniref:hypothetical protein n=1 Tax=Luoshenia tenuis TaxID=2763654 RepID=UPI003D9188DC
MQTTALPILSLIAHPEYPTRYRVNGRFVPPGATVFPLPENGEAFIEALPAAPVEGKRLVARSCAFSFRDGALMPPGAAEGMEVTLWPGNVAEVCLSPMVLPPAPEDVRILSQLRHDFGSGDYLITLQWTPAGIHLSIASLPGGHTVYNRLLPGCSAEYTLTPATFTHEVGDDLLCQFKRYDGRTQLLVITCARGRFATLVDTPADELTVEDGEVPNAVTWRTHSDTFRGWQLSGSVSAAGGVKRARVSSEQPYLRVPTTRQETARCFFDALRLGLWEEAQKYINPALRTGLDQSMVYEFTGDFDFIAAPKFGGFTPEDTFALASPLQGGLRTMRYLTLDWASHADDASRYKIDNIRAH